MKTTMARRSGTSCGRNSRGRPRQSAKKRQLIAAVDLFCGAGGLTRGLIDAGIDVRLGIDVDEACAYPYEANNSGAKFLLSDITKVRPKDLVEAWDGASVRVLAGCAPCQPFSTYTQGHNWKRADRWSLLRAFGKLIKSTKPDIVTMENVASLARHNVFQKFCDTLELLKYEVVWDVLDCRDYGIPQARKRLVLIASKLGTPQLPSPSHANSRKWKTVRDTIAKMPAIRAGQRHPDDPLHATSKLTPLNLARIRASKPGGTWRDWPLELVAKCHTRKKGSTYPAVYGRMEWDAPSPTITGQCFGFGNGRFGHPKQNRALSLREAALLQTFPRHYRFTPPKSEIYMRPLGQLIGNAVPPRLGQVIGEAIRNHVKVSS